MTDLHEARASAADPKPSWISRAWKAVAALVLLVVAILLARVGAHLLPGALE